MAGQPQPLDQKFGIVDRNGNPTEYFIRWAQQRQSDIGDAITMDDLLAYLLAHKLQEGTGIQLTPSGNLSDEPVISADVQEILDQITSTRGAIIYRGLLGWAALLPGTAGEVLKTNGPGADPSWGAGGGGGGGSFTLIATVTLSAAAPSVTFTGIPGTFNDLVIGGQARGDTAATAVEVNVQFNGDTGVNYAFERWNRFGVGASGASNRIEIGSITAATGIASIGNTFNAIISNYKGINFFKSIFSQNEITAGAYPSFNQISNGQWKNAAAINSVTIFPTAGNFVAGSVISLYGRGGVGGAATGANILYSGTDVDLVTDPGAGGTDIVTVAVPAATVARKYMVTGFVTFFGAHAIDAVLKLDGVIKHSTLRYVDGGDRTFWIHCGPVIIDIPGDGAAHTISMASSDVGALGAITISDRWVCAQLVT